mmetsp:Transcript_5254/g.4847  ORF Transcript_5254/g.4847 Transcript_5254/m.4847 type:complete len:140 (+) Transcript_5254:242-661(+)
MTDQSHDYKGVSSPKLANPFITHVPMSGEGREDSEQQMKQAKIVSHIRQEQKRIEKTQNKMNSNSMDFVSNNAANLRNYCPNTKNVYKSERKKPLHQLLTKDELSGIMDLFDKLKKRELSQRFTNKRKAEDFILEESLE